MFTERVLHSMVELPRVQTVNDYMAKGRRKTILYFSSLQLTVQPRFEYSPCKVCQRRASRARSNMGDQDMV